MKRTLQEINDLQILTGKTRSSTKKIADELNVSVVKIQRENEVCEITVKVDQEHISLKIDDLSFEVNCEAKSCKKTCKHTTILMQWWKLRGNELDEVNPKRRKLEEYTPELKENKPKLKIKKKVVKPLPKHLENSVADQELMVQNFANQFEGKTFEEFQNYCSEFMKSRENMLKEAEELTLDQADTDAWHNLRLGRLTASRLYESTRCTMLNGSLVDRIMNVNKGGFSWAMKRGTILEDDVFETVKKEYPSLKKAGLILNPEYPFFGASPDGLSDEFVLEIKCPYTPHTHANYIDVKKLSKKYFAQIQLQMHLTQKQQALLAVADVDFERTKQITKIWIPYDQEYTEGMLEDGLHFYEKAIFPALQRRAARRK